jgi:large subunit ribosomal protein L31e
VRIQEDAEKGMKAKVESTAEKPEELAETAEETEHEEIAEEEQLEETAEQHAEPEAPVSPEEKKAVPVEEEEEEEKPAKEKEEEIVEERVYTVPLGKAWIMPANKRAPRAMRMLQAFITKHMKLEAHKEAEGEEEEEPSRLIISNEVNLRIWSRGIEKPPRKIRVRAAKDKEGNVTVYLAEGD